MIKVEGKNGISATMVLDSIDTLGNRLRTFEFVFPRWILAELNTHRMLSKNSASSRAVPVETMFEQILNNPAMPVHWGVNQSGMSSKEELTGQNLEDAQNIWRQFGRHAVSVAKVLSDKLGINGHKQWVNRLTEVMTMTKTVISGTEWENFFWLRNHPDAQPEFQELAHCALEASNKSTPTLLKAGEWHLPYVQYKDGAYWIDENTQADLETAKMISASCVAQVSYRKLDDTLEKARKIFDMLNIGSKEKPCHASPVEHQATPMADTLYRHSINVEFNPLTWEEGITHVRRDGSFWSGNFQGWIQMRQLIPNEAKW